MSYKKIVLGVACVLLPAAMQLPASAEAPSAKDLMPAEESMQTRTEEVSLHAQAPIDVAQSRRRVASSESRTAPDFIGVGVNGGFVNDVSGVVISKFSITDKVAVRPSVAIGDDVAVLVPVTYQFNNYTPNVGGTRILPYAGLGGSWSNENNNDGRGEVSDLHLLLSAGVDVPVSRRFTVNAQANLGVFNDTEFGATVGIGYNIGNILLD